MNDRAGAGRRQDDVTTGGPPVTPAGANVILFWMCVLVGVNQLGFGAMVATLPLYAQSFGVTASAIGMAVGIYGLARFLTALPAGGMADWLGRRPTLAIGGLVSGLGNLWCAYATGYPEFIVARFVAGAGAGLIVTTGMSYSPTFRHPNGAGGCCRSTWARSFLRSASDRFPAACSLSTMVLVHRSSPMAAPASLRC